MIPAWSGPLTFHAGPGAVQVSAGEDLTVRVDAEGRWRSIGLPGAMLQRTVDGRVVRRRRAGSGGRAVEEVPDDLAASVHDRVRGRIEELLARRSAPEDVAPVLERAATWDAARFEADRARYRAIYRPVGILPPDQYRALVLQPTTGCPWNRCDFCTFYRDQAYSVPSPEDFVRHAREVRAFFGRALPLRRGVFLGEANALALPQRRLLEVLAVVREELGEAGESAAFFDPHHSPARGVAEFAALRAAGLASVSIGLESGCQEALDLLGKGGRVERVVEAVRDARAGGLRIGLMVLVGPGGESLAARHREETAGAIGNMQLDRSDVVFVSPLGQSLPPDRLETETIDLRRAIASATRARTSPYRLEEFQYYA